jgi:hypothetical protein
MAPGAISPLPPAAGTRQPVLFKGASLHIEEARRMTSTPPSSRGDVGDPKKNGDTESEA